MKVYTAGPLGFSEAGRLFHERRIIPLLTQLRHEVLDPWSLTDLKSIAQANAIPYGPHRRDAWRRLNNTIGENNRRAIDACDLVFAVLDGTDVDSGTAAEIGYGFACGKRILGYRGDFRLSADNDGALVNLQVEYFIRASGGELIHTLNDLEGALERASTNALTAALHSKAS